MILLSIAYLVRTLRILLFEAKNPTRRITLLSFLMNLVHCILSLSQVRVLRLWHFNLAIGVFFCKNIKTVSGISQRLDAFSLLIKSTSTFLVRYVFIYILLVFLFWSIHLQQLLLSHVTFHFIASTRLFFMLRRNNLKQLITLLIFLVNSFNLCWSFLGNFPIYDSSLSIIKLIMINLFKC